MGGIGHNIFYQIGINGIITQRDWVLTLYQIDKGMHLLNDIFSTYPIVDLNKRTFMVDG